MKLTPHLRFNDNKAREALDFYKKCFGKAEITIQTVGESPMASQMPKESHNKVMHATFASGGLEFTSSDMMMDKAVIGDQISLMLECDSEEQLRSFFDKLTEGGAIFMPVEKMFWGALFGVITDKYGMEWSLNYTLKS